MWQNDRLLATSKNGASHLNAYLDDYAFLLNGLIKLLQSQWDMDLLIWAQEIAKILIEQFEDTEHGVFFFTGHDHEKLIQRFKAFNDAAMPSGNGMAACALLDLDYLCSNPIYLKAARYDINQAPISHCALLNALDKLMSPPTIAILRGNTENLKIWQQNLGTGYMPHTLIFAISEQDNLPAWLEDKRIIDSSNTYAYICEGQTCHDPITSFDEFFTYIGIKIKS
jgi:uncharacterized protein YyaL (SSP411 family)